MENRRTKMTKKLIKDAFIELLDKRPITKISVKDICEAADINRSTFYAHYQDQMLLFSEIEDDIVNITPSINITVKEPREKMFEDFFTYIGENKNIYRIMFKNSPGNLFRGKILNKVYGKTSSDNSWISSVDINREIEFKMLMCAFGGIDIVEKWIFGEINAAPYELAVTMAKYIE